LVDIHFVFQDSRLMYLRRYWRVRSEQRWLSLDSNLQKHCRKFHMYLPLRIHRKWNPLLW